MRKKKPAVKRLMFSSERVRDLNKVAGGQCADTCAASYDGGGGGGGGGDYEGCYTTSPNCKTTLPCGGTGAA